MTVIPMIELNAVAALSPSSGSMSRIASRMHTNMMAFTGLSRLLDTFSAQAGCTEGEGQCKTFRAEQGAAIPACEEGEGRQLHLQCEE